VSRSPFLRFMLTHAGLGVSVGVALGAAMLGFDLFGLGTLVRNSAEPTLAVFLLMFGLSVTFGSCAIGTAVMTLPWDDGGTTLRRRLRLPAVPRTSTRQPSPVRVPRT